MRRVGLVVALVFVFALAACSDSEPDARGEPISCTSEQGVKFETALGSCDEAFEVGQQIAYDMGLVTGPDTPAGAVEVAVNCMSVKPGSGMHYRDPSTKDFATKLVDAGVCVGDPDELTPATN